MQYIPQNHNSTLMVYRNSDIPKATM